MKFKLSEKNFKRFEIFIKFVNVALPLVFLLLALFSEDVKDVVIMMGIYVTLVLSDAVKLENIAEVEE